MADTPPTPHAVSGTRMLARGLRRRCPRCGGGHIFDGYYRLKERCPSCGWHFERDEGFFSGAFLINFGFAEGLLVVVIMGYVFWRATDHDHSPLWPILTTAGLVAVLAPILFYPFACGIWLAAELMMRPLDPVEEADALLHEPDPPVA